jgi:hypothetical protein
MKKTHPNAHPKTLYSHHPRLSFFAMGTKASIPKLLIIHPFIHPSFHPSRRAKPFPMVQPKSTEAKLEALWFARSQPSV